MLKSAQVKNDVVTAFKMHGLTLRSEASKYLTEVMLSIPEELRRETIKRFVSAVQKQPLESVLIDRAICENVVLEFNSEEDDGDALKTFDSFSLPRFTYSAERKKFIAASNGKPDLFAGAEAKIMLFRERFSILYQRTLRHELFVPPVLGGLPASQQNKKFELKPVEFLLGSTVKIGNIIVLGLLTQLKEARWYIEDPTGAVPVDLSRANFHTGLFTENCFVLAEGWYEDGTFHVNAFGFPPPETSETTRAQFGNMNLFGGSSKNCAKASTKFQRMEQLNEEAMFVILSDVWLDQAKVLEKFKVLLTGYSEAPPTCFILFGTFLSQNYGPKQAAKLKDCFEDLAELIGQFPSLVQGSRFIFVPGPQDVGGMGILPRPPLPACLVESLLKKVPKAEFVTNPCRMQYFTQEIVLFREDIIMKMCRNCVRYPSDGVITNHFAKTLVSQSHLCSLPLHVLPVYWAYDHALSLYPLPDLIICADKHDAYAESQSECSVINPGSFPRNDFSFKVYYPATRQVEDSRIDV